MNKNIKETKIATYTENKTRVQLLKISTQEREYYDQLVEDEIITASRSTHTIKYQIRLNRKRFYTTRFEYDARKYFATIVQNNILQLKIY